MADDTLLTGFHWRIHWIYCGLTRQSFALLNAEQLRTLIEYAHTAFDRLVWEYTTIKDCYSSESLKVLRSGPQFERLQEAVSNALKAHASEVQREAETMIQVAAAFEAKPRSLFSLPLPE